MNDHTQIPPSLPFSKGGVFGRGDFKVKASHFEKGGLRGICRTPRAIFILSLTAIFFTSCSKSPIDRTKDPSGSGAIGTGPSSSFVIFSDELRSGGGAFEYPGGENQTLTFNDTSNPVSRRSIRYNWNGQPVSNPGCSPNPTHDFAGFDLMHVTQQSAYATTPGRNLSAFGYTKATFFVRGSLSTNTILKVEVASAGPNGACSSTPSPCVDLSVDGTDDDGTHMCDHRTLTSDWQQQTIFISPSYFATTAIKDFFKATFIFTDPYVGSTAPGQGGTAYFDEIEYQP